MKDLISTKIIATLGPSSESKEQIKELAQAGVTMFRLNSSHGDEQIQLNRLNFIREIEKSSGLEAKLEMYPMQDGDVNQTWADVTELKNKFGYNPNFPVDKGVYNFVKWYKEYYK